MVVDAVFRRGKKAVLSAEAEDVPGIDEGPAFDRAVQQGDGFLQQAGSLLQPPASRQRSSRRSSAAGGDLVSPAPWTCSIARWPVVSRQWMSQRMRAEATGTIRGLPPAAASVCPSANS